MDRIGILIQLLGNEKAIKDLRTLSQFQKQLNNKALNIRINTNNTQKQIDNLQKKIDNMVRSLQQMRLNRSYFKVGSDGWNAWTGAIKKAQQALINLRREQDKLNSSQRTNRSDLRTQNESIRLVRDQIKALKEQESALKKISAYNKEIQRAEQAVSRGRLLGMNTAEIERSIAEVKQLRDELAKLYNVDRNYVGLGNLTSQFNANLRQAQQSAMSIRDIFSGMGTWFSSIGSGLQSIGGLFNTDIMSYITQTITSAATSAVMSNLGAATTRFDVLGTYPQYMEAIGIDSNRATASLKAVDKAIQGLPIGLDEAALDVRRTTMLMNGDIETATKFVQGFDQALIAGGAPQQMRNYAYLEMQRLLTTGELSQKRQWMSLINGLGVSVPYLKNAMGYTDMSVKEFEAMVYDPDQGVAGEEVIQGFANLADDDELKRLIEIYKGTLESGMSNMKYALVRGMQKTFDAVNDVLIQNTGMNFSDYLYSGRNFLDRTFEGAANWIRQNPDTIDSVVHQLEGLFKRAESFDWGKMSGNIIGGIQSLVNILTFVYDHVPDWLIQKFITFSLVWATPLGKGFSALGSLFSTLAFLPFPKWGRLTKGMRGMGQFMGGIKGIGKGFLGASAYIGIIAEIGLVVFELTKVAETIANADLDGFWKNFGKVAGFGGIITGLATAMTAIFSAISAIPGGALVVGAGELLTAGFVGVIAEIGAVVYEFTKVAEHIASANLPNTQKINRVFEVIQAIATGVSEVELRLGTRMRANTIDRMTEMLEGLSDALPALKNIADADIDTAKLNSTVTTVLNAYKTIDDTIASFMSGYENRTNLRMNSWQDSKIVENISAVIEDIGATIDALGGIEDKLNEYGLFATPTGEHNQTLERMRITFMDILKMGNEINNLVSEWKGPILTKFKEIKTSMEDEIIKNYNDAIQSIADMIETIHSNKETFASIYVGHGHNRGLAPEFYQAKESIKEVLESISNDEGTGMLDGIYESANAFKMRIKEQDWESIASITADMETAMTSITGIFTKMQEYADPMKWVGQIRRNGGEATFQGTVDNFNKLVEAIQTINFESINGIDTTNLVANSENILIAMNRVAGIVQTLQTNAAAFAKANEEGGSVYQFKKMLNDLMTALSGNGGTISAANYTAMATAIQTLSTALSGIASVDLGNVTGDIKSMAKELKDLAQKAKDGAKYLNDLRDKMIAAAGVANSNSNKYDGYISSLTSIANQALRAYDNVSSLINELNAISDKTITIQIDTPGLDDAILGLRTLNAMSSAASAASRAVNAVSSLFRASGGKVNYLAKGGMPMKPRGTDTIPAMLTEGEWVINRRASRAFGDDFMRKINRMDIPGAMDALMKRSKWVPSGGVYYTTNNYNNQSVTQHFSDKKDSKTSYRRANRYLGAL